MAFPEPFFCWRPHPWHGLDTDPDAPEVVTAFIQISPFDVVNAAMADYDDHFGS